MRTGQIILFEKQPLGLTLIVGLAANEHEHEVKTYPRIAIALL